MNGVNHSQIKQKEREVYARIRVIDKRISAKHGAQKTRCAKTTVQSQRVDGPRHTYE